MPHSRAPSDYGAANRPELEWEFRKIYTLAAIALQERTDVRSKVDVIIWDFDRILRERRRGDHGRAILKNGQFENQTIKDGEKNEPTND